MQTQKTEFLVTLINSLTKAEKRSFRLFVTRNQASEDILFLKLFNDISKRGYYDERQLLKIKGLKKRQLSNLKAHLYKQLLLCLRMLNRAETVDMEIRENIDFARVFYIKGLYRQALDQLAKAKQKALRYHQHLLALDIVEFEKSIESQYITRSIEGRAEELASEAQQLDKKIRREQEFTNLSIQLYSLYLQYGYVKDRESKSRLDNFVKEKMPDYHPEKEEFYESIYLYQSQVWVHYMNQDFLNYYRSSMRWFQLFDEHPQMIGYETPLYLKALHNILTALFLSQSHDRFSEMLATYESLEDQHVLTTHNEHGLYQLYYYIHQINKHFFEGTFTEGTQKLPPLIELLETNPYNWDKHRIMLFQYKIACMYFGSGDWGETITWLNRIINPKHPDFRADIQGFARILNLIAHFELGNDLLLEYQIKSVYRYLSKKEELQSVQYEIFRFLRQSPNMFKHEMTEHFQELLAVLKPLRNDPLEKRAFLYLDIISWLESKIRNVPVEQVIREKFQSRIAQEKTTKLIEE